MSQGLWQEEPEAQRQTLKGSQDGALGPWLTSVVVDPKVEIKLGGK